VTVFFEQATVSRRVRTASELWRRLVEPVIAGDKTYVILAPTPDVDSEIWLSRIKAEDARRKAVEAQLADGEASSFALCPKLA
jgi:hypothetical protein